MAEFRFQLETLLRLRQAARDDCRRRLEESHREDEDLRDRLARLADERRRLSGRLRRATASGELDVDGIIEIERYISVLGSEEKRLESRRETLAAEIEQRRRTLVKADQDAKGLEKLRQRQLIVHRRKENRNEVKLHDEMALAALWK